MGYNQMKVAASRIGELERQSSLSGDSQSAMALRRIKRILRQSMDDAVEQGRISLKLLMPIGTQRQNMHNMPAT